MADPSQYRKCSELKTFATHLDTVATATAIVLEGYAGGCLSGLTTGSYQVYGSMNNVDYVPVSETVRDSANAAEEQLVTIEVTTGRIAVLPPGVFGLRSIKLVGVTVASATALLTS